MSTIIIVIIGSINNIIVPISTIIKINNTLLLEITTRRIYMFKSIPIEDSQFPQLPKYCEMEFGP